jgi:hypothetical protein
MMDGIRFVLVVAGPAFIGLTLATLALPESSRVRPILQALTLRLGLLVVVGLVAMPIQPVAGLNVAYDVTAALLLIWSAVTFVVQAARVATTPGLPATVPVSANFAQDPGAERSAHAAPVFLTSGPEPGDFPPGPDAAE